jgi:biopolymer transport protein ExbD
MKLSHRARPRTRTIDDALLPLVNVVFLLMVFFLSMGHFGGPKPIDNAPKSERIEQRAAAAPRLLELRGTAQLVMQGQTVVDAELSSRAQAWQGAPLDVRARGDVPADRVLRLLAVLRAAGVRDVRLLTVKVGGG